MLTVLVYVTRHGLFISRTPLFGTIAFVEAKRPFSCVAKIGKGKIPSLLWEEYIPKRNSNKRKTFVTGELQKLSWAKKLEVICILLSLTSLKLGGTFTALRQSSNKSASAFDNAIAPLLPLFSCDIFQVPFRILGEDEILHQNSDRSKFWE